MAAFLPLLIQAGISGVGGILGRDKGTSLTSGQKSQNEFLDLIMQAIRGEGPLAGLVQGDEDAFQKSVVDPSLQRFNQQIAPGIQQNFIQDRLQRGTGLDDSLSRAGVDLQSNIDEKFLDFQQGGQDRMLQLIQAALGFTPNVAEKGQTALQGFGQGITDFSSGIDVSGLLDRKKKREGFTE